MALVDDYTTAIHAELRPLRARWPIGEPLQLGDYGPISGGDVFEVRGNLRDIGIAFQVRPDAGSDSIEHTSERGVSWSLTARADAVAGGVPARAKLEIEFSARHAIFMALAGCRWHSIDNLDSLRDALKAALADGAWKDYYRFVYKLAIVDSSTIVIGSSSGAKATLEASADVPQIVLSDASIKLAPTFSREVGHKVVSAGGLTPLFALANWWESPFAGDGGIRVAGAELPFQLDV